MTPWTKWVSCDFTNTYTGRHAGAVSLLEQDLGHRLVEDSCMLHINELPLRHPVIDLDGPTTGEDSFSGPIGKLYLKRQLLFPVAVFSQLLLVYA